VVIIGVCKDCSPKIVFGCGVWVGYEAIKVFNLYISVFNRVKVWGCGIPSEFLSKPLLPHLDYPP